MNVFKKAVIDTNILLLTLCAAAKQNPSGDSRLSRYTADDITIIENLLTAFSSLIVTPNILTETSNMTKGFEAFQHLREFSSKAIEMYIPSNSVVNNPYFYRFGLTDVSLLDQQFNECSVITDDFELSQLLRSQDRSVIYYQEYRDACL